MSTKPRFFLGESEFANEKFYLKDHDAIKHARKILRLKIGDEVELFDGNGNVFVGEIEKLTKELMVVLVSDAKFVEDDTTHIILAQGLPKAGKLDKILRMNTEIGVREFIPFESEYSVVKSSDITKKKLHRFRRIIEQSARQSKNNYLPNLSEPISFEDLMDIDADQKIILNAKSGNDDLTTIKNKIDSDSRIFVIIGPEGGFSEKELEVAKNAGFQTIKLNLPVLRTETAGVVVCSFLLI